MSEPLQYCYDPLFPDGSARAGESGVSMTTVLVADDFDRFREIVCRELRQRADVRVVSVADGWAAVEAAEAIEPDLALLDLGLPSLNGIAAATAIRARCPGVKIVFLTQESAPDVVNAALALGAHGYVVKTRAHGYLMSALDAILNGHSRVGAGGSVRGHNVQFHGNDESLLQAAERFVLGTLEARDAALLVLTRAHLDALGDGLRQWAPLVDQACRQGTYVAVDAHELIASVPDDDPAAWDRFSARFADTIARAGAATRRPRPRVAAFGEPAALLLASGRHDAARRLEAMGHALVGHERPVTFELTCVYPLLTFRPDASFTELCGAHAAVAIQ